MGIGVSFLARIRTGLQLTKGSFRVLRKNMWLLVFPLLYGLTWVLGLLFVLGGVIAALFGAGYGLAAMDSFVTLADDAGETAVQAIALGAMVVFLFLTTAAATFFTGALVYSVGRIFEDKPTGVKDGLAGSWKAKRTILAWGVVGTIVGLLIRGLENRGGRGARLVQGLLGFAWAAMTFFIIPVIVFEREGLRASFSKSVSIFRNTWGEAAVLNLGVGLVVFPFILLVGGLGIGAPLFLLESPETVLALTVVPTVLVIGVLLVIHQAAAGIAKTALYEYAIDGNLPDDFDGLDPEKLARQRQTSGMTPGASQPGNI